MVKTLRLIIPSINISALSILAKFMPIGVWIGYTALLLIWRVQVTTSLSPSFNKIEEIQTLDTQKNIATIMSNSLPTKSLLAANALGETLYLEKDAISSGIDLSDHLNNIVSELTTNPEGGTLPPGKVLPSKLLTSENVTSHRGGLINKTRGIIQTRGIYSPMEILQGIIPSNLRIQDSIPLIDSLYTAIDITPTLEDFKTVFPQINVETTENVTPGEITTQYFIADISSRNFVFNDGINLGTQNNLFPIEKSLNITRNLPPSLSVDPIPEDIDPLMKLVLTQQNNAAKQITVVRTKKVISSPSSTSQKQTPPPAAAAKKKSPRKSSSKGRGQHNGY
jgi:hypothetical protein